MYSINVEKHNINNKVPIKILFIFLEIFSFGDLNSKKPSTREKIMLIISSKSIS
ncbi:hypothetical protein SAMN05428642_102376 [Flaviramulus basaltis]|uniref:Uncharacterized protein n=1 Tax=Flaviramulus basaltis TaxID=369401 RepID=A0A1K2IHB8_9FLAO|nr:hypothetical protein SAMN05428642_102376 [Flaviramulus basaltis]